MKQMDLFEGLDQEDAKSLLSILLDQSRLYYHSRDYKEFLDFVTRLPNFAPFNAFLLHLQKPGLRFAASQHDWLCRFGREVKEGARPLLILWPFGPIALVYDMEDTDGEPLPRDVEKAFRATGEMVRSRITAFRPLLHRKGIELKFVEYGDGHAGHVRYEQEVEGLEVGERSVNSKTRPVYRVRINSKHDPNVQFVTLAHELAHLYLGHLGPDAFLHIPNRSAVQHGQSELEAESVAYLVSSRSGVVSESEKYLSNYVHDNRTVEALDLYLVLKAAGQIETVLQLGEKVSFGVEH